MELWDFEGAWSLARRIRHDGGARASFEGRATLSREGSGLRYREEGVLRLAGGTAVAATRVYLWRPAPGGVAVRFEDGRPFHAIDLRRARPEAVHLCGADTYRVAYDLTAWPLWTARWRVDGPRHAYRLVTRHAPLAGGGEMGHPAGERQEDPAWAATC